MLKLYKQNDETQNVGLQSQNGCREKYNDYDDGGGDEGSMIKATTTTAAATMACQHDRSNDCDDSGSDEGSTVVTTTTTTAAVANRNACENVPVYICISFAACCRLAIYRRHWSLCLPVCKLLQCC